MKILNFSPLRILNPSNVKGSNEGRLFYFEIINEDNMYERVEMAVDDYYQDVVNRNGPSIPKQKIVRGDKAVLRVSTSGFRRVQVRGLSVKGETRFVNVSYLDSDGPLITVLRRDLYELDMTQQFASVAPRRQYLTLDGLSGFTDDSCFEKFLQQYSEDLFTGKLEAEFLKVSKGRRASNAIIWGEKYPRNEFPLGLNGLIIDKLLERMNESSASKFKNMIKDLGETKEVLRAIDAMVLEDHNHDVAMDWFIWSDMYESFQVFSPGKTCIVEIVQASPDGKRVSMVCPKRKRLLKKLESELFKGQLNFKYEKADAFFTLKTAKCFIYWWPEKEVYARVLLLKNLEGLRKLQGIGLGRLNAASDLYLMDYGITLQNTQWQQLIKIPQEACRYPPFALIGSVQGEILWSGHKYCKATMLSLTFDPFGVPLAQVSLSKI